MRQVKTKRRDIKIFLPDNWCINDNAPKKVVRDLDCALEAAYRDTVAGMDYYLAFKRHFPFVLQYYNRFGTKDPEIKRIAMKHLWNCEMQITGLAKKEFFW